MRGRYVSGAQCPSVNVARTLIAGAWHNRGWLCRRRGADVKESQPFFQASLARLAAEEALCESYTAGARVWMSIRRRSRYASGCEFMDTRRRHWKRVSEH